MRKSPVLSSWNIAQKRFTNLSSRAHFFGIISLFLLAISIPTTVFLAQQNQDIRQKAQASITCDSNNQQTVVRKVGCRKIDGKWYTCTRTWKAATVSGCKLQQVSEDYDCSHIDDDDPYTDQACKSGSVGETGNFCNSAEVSHIKFADSNRPGKTCWFDYKLEKTASGCEMKLQNTNGRCDSPPTPTPDPQACEKKGGRCTVACNWATDTSLGKDYGECNAEQHCCVAPTQIPTPTRPASGSCTANPNPRYDFYKCMWNKKYYFDNVKDTENAHIWVEKDKKQLKFNTKNVCLWKDSGEKGYHSSNTPDCDSSCWGYKDGEKVKKGVACLEAREACLTEALNTRDRQYKACDSDTDATKCFQNASETFEKALDKCAEEYNKNDSACAKENAKCFAPPNSSGAAPVPTKIPTTNGGEGGGGGGRSPTPTPTRTQSGGGARNPTPTTRPGGEETDTCAKKSDSNYCVYSEESGLCYAGRKKDKNVKGIFNVKGCQYDGCGAVDCPQPEKQQGREYLNCKPGEPVGEDEKACPNGKKGTCGGHYYCVWGEEGNYKSEFKCETEKETCSDKDSSGGDNSCKDNPTAPPDGYKWKNSCKACSDNDQCPKNTKDGAVNPDTSNWCFNGQCLMLVSGENSSKDDNKSNKNKDKDKDKNKNKNKNKDKDDDRQKGKDNQNLRGNGRGTKSGNEAKNLSNQPKNSRDKSDRDKAQKPIDKLNKQLMKEGKPTLTPLPPDWSPKDADKNNNNNNGNNNAGPTATPVPTLAPPLAEPTNWQATCGPTTNPQKPFGIKVSWNAVNGATRYAVRIDEDAPSWEGDTPGPGDTVANEVKDTVFVREAKAGAVYQWWVHTVNASGVYSKLTMKKVIKCPEPNAATNQASRSAGSVGAGELIVLP